MQGGGGAKGATEFVHSFVTFFLQMASLSTYAGEFVGRSLTFTDFYYVGISRPLQSDHATVVAWAE